ncbi:MAG TPA: hypothetical protein VIF62_37475 [Labilithrix sp.]
MSRRIAIGCAVLLLSLPGRALADDDDVPKDFARLVLDTGRREVPPPLPDGYRFVIHGEYQIRYQAQKSFVLDSSASAIASHPGLVADSLGQNQIVTHWLRMTPRLQLRDDVELVAQADILTGMVFGERAHDTSADESPRNDYDGFSNVQPRYLYVQYKLPVGIVRIGQQPNHWGMGILANDGDHPSLFGDYRYGSLSDRILFATKPGGKDSDFYVALAGDLVFRDPTAQLVKGEHAFQGVLAAFWEHAQNTVGVFSTVRHQENDKSSGSSLYSYTDSIDAVAIDLHGKVVVPVPGEDSFAFAEAEAAYILGSTNLLRTNEQALDGTKTQIRSWGGAAIVGVAHRAHAKGFWCDKDGDPKYTSARYLGHAEDSGVPYGDVVAQVEVGYASGDADPLDGTQRRFVFDPNHKVGLLLFDEVMRWQTSRAATAAVDPLLTNTQRPTPGVDLLPSNGGVYGAQYVNPTFIYRPRHRFDLKSGMVIAQSTADVVDPYRLATTGNYVNYRGGDPKKKDLGVEVDGGFEARFPLEYDILLQLGAQAGVLFPGGALEDPNGIRMPVQWLAMGRLGIQY